MPGCIITSITIAAADNAPETQQRHGDIRYHRNKPPFVNSPTFSASYANGPPSPRNTAKMPMEAVMIIVDNSESSRNGDYHPTRFEAQADAVSVLFRHITNGNPESEVGLMSMAGKGPEVLVTMTTEQGKILEGLHRTKKCIRGDAHLMTALQVALVCGGTMENMSNTDEIEIPFEIAINTKLTNSSRSATARTRRSARVSWPLYARRCLRRRRRC